MGWGSAWMGWGSAWMGWGSAWTAGCMATLAVFVAGCGASDQAAPEVGDAPPDATEDVPPPYQSVAEEGPVRATITLAPAAPRLGDPLTLELAVDAEPGVIVEMPEFGEALGRFSILDFAPRRNTTADGGTVERQRYTLQAPMSGRQRIPSLRIAYVDERGGGAATERELLTDELAFEVASVIPEGAALDALLPARPPLPEMRQDAWRGGGRSCLRSRCSRVAAPGASRYGNGARWSGSG